MKNPIIHLFLRGRQADTAIWTALKCGYPIYFWRPWSLLGYTSTGNHLAALQKYLELKGLFCQCNSGPHRCLYLTLNLISVTFECKVALRKADLPTVQRFLSLQKMKLPFGCIGLMSQIRFVTSGKLCGGCWNSSKPALLQGLPFWAVILKFFFSLSLHPPKNVISQRGWDERPHKTQIIQGWKAAIGKKEGTYQFMSQKKRYFLPLEIPVTVPKIQDHQIHCNGDWELPRRFWRRCKSSKFFPSSSARVGFACCDCCWVSRLLF